MKIKAEPWTHDPLYSATTYSSEKLYEATTGGNMSEQLKRCPFCGGKPRVNTNTGWGNAVVISCVGCGAEITEFGIETDTNLKNAINKWNRRTHDCSSSRY